MAASAGGAHDCEGHVEITNSGVSSEATFTVSFPIRFTQMPVFSAGYSLADNQSFTAGSLPNWSATVLKWDFGARAGTGERYYDGATICFVITGAAGQKGVGHYRFSGKALVGPAGR